MSDSSSREALMRLTMCAREECDMCKYKDECDYEFQYKISTDNMNTLSDALLRSKCEVDAKPAEAVHKPDYSYEADMVRRLKESRSAEAVQGEWVIRENGNKECSLCGHERQDGWDYFCGYCGARMYKGGDLE